MNEIFNTLRDKFPFLSLIRKGELEYVGGTRMLGPRPPPTQLPRHTPPSRTHTRLLHSTQGLVFHLTAFLLATTGADASLPASV